mgnify:CR=1 FL=1
MERENYHHGDLKNALIQAGIEILAEEGVGGLSLRKAARVLGIDPSTLLRKAEKHQIKTGVAPPQQPPYIFNGQK